MKDQNDKVTISLVLYRVRWTGYRLIIVIRMWYIYIYPIISTLTWHRLWNQWSVCRPASMLGVLWILHTSAKLKKDNMIMTHTGNFPHMRYLMQVVLHAFTLYAILWRLFRILIKNWRYFENCNPIINAKSRHFLWVFSLQLCL